MSCAIMAWHVQPSEAWAMTHHEWWQCAEFKNLGKEKAMTVDDVREMERRLLGTP